MEKQVNQEQNNSRILIKENVKVLVVLGCEIYQKKVGEWQPEHDLKFRLDKAIECYQKNLEGFDMIICSGRGRYFPSNHPSEAQVMAEYIYNLIPSINIPIELEDNSMNTIENAIFVYFKLYKNVIQQATTNLKSIQLTILTSDFHINRSRKIFEYQLGRLSQIHPILSEKIDQNIQTIESKSRFYEYKEDQRLIDIIPSWTEEVIKMEQDKDRWKGEYIYDKFQSSRQIDNKYFDDYLEFLQIQRVFKN